MKNRWIKSALIVLVVAILGVLFYKKVYIPKTTYQTLRPTTGTMEKRVFGIGEVDAKEIYPVTTQTGGRLMKLTKDQGEWVKKGALIAQIDPVDLPDQLESAKIARQKAMLQINALRENLTALGARAKLAKVTYARTLKLYRQKFASRAEYDKAKSDLDNLNAQIDALKVQIESAEYEAKRAAKSIEALQAKLARFTVLSPIDGYVVARNAQVDQTLMPSQPIVTLVDPKTVWVKINIDEHISGEVAVGQPAKITLRSRPHTPLAGRVARIEAQSDPVTEERIVDVAFEKIPQPFYLKERAEATIVTGTLSHAVIIPARALAQNEGKTGVWIARSGYAHFQPLKIVATDRKNIAVEGVSADATILIPSAEKKPLKEGMRIHL